jgi:hypothetical protein
MQDHTSRRFHELWDAFFTRWTLSAPCALTGEREWISTRAARRVARDALFDLRMWYTRIGGEPQSYA